MTRRPFVNVTLATWRTAEFGFFGDLVVTLFTIPLTCGLFCNAGVLVWNLILCCFDLKVACLKVAIYILNLKNKRLSSKT